ncbi:MAG TPA: hypothetical protein VM597_32765 [Gemmataceae bacterium]|nr:hypothetical protein [Gemmataceae bacterium]
MADNVSKPDPRNPEPADRHQGPPEEEFWDKYNKRLEFPLSTVATILLHVLVGTIIVLILLRMESKEDHSSVDVKFMSISGMDDYGAGSPGSGGREEPIVERMNQDPATAAEQSLADPSKLPEIKEKTIKLIDPTGNLPITSANAVAYEGLDKAIRDKLLGANRGTGNTPGKGIDGSGTGPGGTGADSTLGRNLRWTLRFRIQDGRDYLRQLDAMGAKILVPRPGTEQCVVVDQPANPASKRVVGQDQLGPYADVVKFADSRPAVVRDVAIALQLEFTPKTFFAVFSKELELDLARMERNHANRRAEQIEETIFVVTVSGGTYSIKVAEQKLR